MNFSPQLHRNSAGDDGEELPRQGKTSDLQCEQQPLEEAGARLDVQRCFSCLLGRTEAVLERAQPGARLAPSPAQGKKVSPSVLRQVDIEGEMPK